MKTSVKTLFVTALTAVVLSSSAFVSTAAEKSTHHAVWSSKIDFNKVVIRGNVKIELVQADQQKVVVYEAYDKSLTSIEQKGDKLFISSKEDQPIHMVIYIKDLQRIDASNNVSVVTRGRFSSNVLQVFLKDSAKAYVNGNISSLYTVIKGKSELKLKGSSEQHTSVTCDIAKLKTEEFAALKTTTGAVEGDTWVLAESRGLPKDTVITRNMIEY